MGNKTTWERTSVRSLLRNLKSGRYYGRWIISGKQNWVKLDTDVLNLTKLRLNDDTAKIEKLRTGRAGVVTGAGTVGDLMLA